MIENESIEVFKHAILWFRHASANVRTKITAKRQPHKPTVTKMAFRNNATRYGIVALQTRLDMNRRSSNATRYESSLFKCDSIWIVALQIRLDMNRVLKWNNIMKNHHPHLAAWSAIGIGMYPKEVWQPRKQRVYTWQAMSKKSSNDNTTAFVNASNGRNQPMKQ